MALNQRIDHPPAAKDKLPAAQRNLWDALHRYCRQHGAEVTSVPWHRTMRVEIPKSEDSTLAAKLRDAGYTVRHHGAATRIANGTFASVDILEIDLPSRR
jgi:hypothetical protein